MSVAARPSPRRQQILESLALMLEQHPGGRITTAGLAEAVGVSEAALYRHFPSKARMFEGLIEFAESTLLTRFHRLQAESRDGTLACQQALTVLLAFSEKNPGITRLLTGDALAGEADRLRQRTGQLFERLKVSLRQILNDAERHQGLRTQRPVAVVTDLLLAVAQGRMLQYVHSDFAVRPTDHWDDQWQLLTNGLFRSTARA